LSVDEISKGFSTHSIAFKVGDASADRARAQRESLRRQAPLPQSKIGLKVFPLSSHHRDERLKINAKGPL
jgi:hypothetical protein